MKDSFGNSARSVTIRSAIGVWSNVLAEDTAWYTPADRTGSP
jgi:hypothetical protein